jgi:hypothetical protein
MAGLAGRFGGIEFHEVVGYRIGAVYTPSAGFQGAFFVYVMDRSDAATPFKQGVDPGKDGKPITDMLQFADADHTYAFEDISLFAAQVGATRAHRYRTFEFKYDANVIDVKQPTITLEAKHPHELNKNALEDDYRWSVVGKEQYLLGFSALAAASASSAYRFHALQTGANSILPKLIEANLTRMNRQAMETMTINFSQAQLEVNDRTAARIIVEESFGSLLQLPSKSLEEMRQVNLPSTTALVRRPIHDLSAAELLQFEADPHSSYSGNGGYSSSVQTVTVVFHQGHYQSLPVK